MKIGSINITKSGRELTIDRPTVREVRTHKAHAGCNDSIKHALNYVRATQAERVQILSKFGH